MSSASTRWRCCRSAATTWPTTSPTGSRSAGAKASKLPRIFYVNWFRKDDDGKFLWPGFGENSRVLAWIFRRCEDDCGGGRDGDRVRAAGRRGRHRHRAGWTSRAEAVEKLLEVDPELWLEAAPADARALRTVRATSCRMSCASSSTSSSVDCGPGPTSEERSSGAPRTLTCVALPFIPSDAGHAGVAGRRGRGAPADRPGRWLERFRGRGWALVPIGSIVVVIFAIRYVSDTAAADRPRARRGADPGRGRARVGDARGQAARGARGDPAVRHSRGRARTRSPARRPARCCPRSAA